MAVSKQELKRRACEAIDKNRDKIVALGDSIFSEPELGYKEFKTSEKIKKAFDEMGYKYQDGVAITGVVAPLKGKESKIRVAVMGEMDAVVAPGHRCANKETGAAHSCGHNCMCAGLVGVGYAFAGTGIMEELSGDVVLMAVPAEEYVEIEYRNELKKAGKIWFLGGKQEFVKLGVFDDIDIMIMQHTSTFDGTGVKGVCGGTGNGFMGKLVRYIGKEAHAGGAPHLGINALNAAQIGLMAVNANRETFQDKDHIRVHPIITKGGDLVNVVPADVRIETYVRGANVDAILDASAKVSRAFKAGADAVGAKCEITDLPGYLPTIQNYDLFDIMYENMKEVFGDEKFVRYENTAGGGSTDAGDISYLMPMIHSYFIGAEGIGHSENYEIADKDIAYIAAAKCLAMTAIDLLADGAELGLKVKANFKPTFTKEEYLEKWGLMTK
ncbi:amidohydrolase [Merdimmobilis hominis]|jgi:amidohydrolase|uniref:amidohydrolase n=2 Tax=Merdimmobilis hominis TaxID=2897707 RepID=UPI0006C78575|nr:amidohydrolase [Merdimmobilis hominis]MCD4835762.1 amidohydrolase [Merdimmobilis hominis]